MRFAILASSLLVLLLGGAGQAAEGDGLVVTGDGVNVRARPQSGAPVLLQVHRQEPAVELTREDDWVQVRLPERDTVGWIHGSLLGVTTAAPQPTTIVPQPTAAAPETTTPAPDAAQPPVTAAAGQEQSTDGAGAAMPPTDGAQLAAVDVGADTALASFRESVENLNERARAAAGVDLFTDVTLAGDGFARITATEAWGVVPEGGRQSYMNALFNRWTAAAGRPLARLQIVDESGQVLSERSGP